MSSIRDRPAAPEWALPVREALQRREPDALAAFFDAYFERVFAYVERLVRDEHLAEDLTQDVFLHVHRALPTYDPERPLAPWVFTIATNKVRDHWRSRRSEASKKDVGLDEADEAPAVAAQNARPEDGLASEELSAQVARAVGELPEMLRQTLVLRYYEGLSFEAIAAIVDRNETAVRKRYSRALQELRRLLPRVPGTDSTIIRPSPGGAT